MIWTAWNNSQHHPSGAGYGLRLSPRDRDALFSRNWDSVTVELPVGPTFDAVEVRISPSFWGECPELRNKKIGRWLIANGHAAWRHNDPPRFDVVRVADRVFRIEGKSVGTSETQTLLGVTEP